MHSGLAQVIIEAAETAAVVELDRAKATIDRITSLQDRILATLPATPAEPEVIPSEDEELSEPIAPTETFPEEHESETRPWPL